MGPAMTNSAPLAAADATTTVVVTGDNPSMRHDRGDTFLPAFTAPRRTGWLDVGFTIPTVGVALSRDRPIKRAVPDNALAHGDDT